MIAIPHPHSYAVSLVCSKCKRNYAVTRMNAYSPCCNKPLIVEYDHETELLKEDLLFREKNMWRYFEMLPVFDKKNIVSLGEGMTPLISLENLSSHYGFSDLWMKDESFNPTGSFKARGMSAAVSKAKELGVKKCILPTAGNAGVAAAAYCAKAGIECTVVMPSYAPDSYKEKCRLYGAKLFLIDGFINDCAKKVAELKKEDEYYDLSTLKEPYRLEGKKTMGYEIAEQFNWQLPDVVLYPTGGGTGLIGIWKAFHELLQMGWIEEPLPKMIAVQSKNCDPVIKAFSGKNDWQNFIPQSSIAQGLIVPNPFGMDLILQTLHESNGTTVSVSEEEMISSIKEFARTEGLLISPEGAALWNALLLLEKAGVIHAADKILLLNTGSYESAKSIL